MCYGRANKVGHPYCLNNNSYLCQHSHDHPHDLVICKAVSFIEVLFHVLYFTFARVVPSPWDGSPSPGVLNSRNHEVLNSRKDSGCLFVVCSHSLSNCKCAPENRAHGLQEELPPLLQWGKPWRWGRVVQAVRPKTIHLLSGGQGQVVWARHLSGEAYIVDCANPNRMKL